jgi:hypothetical protein
MEGDGMHVLRHWQTGAPCSGCGCQAVTDSPAGRLRAHLADCPRLDVNQLRHQLRGAVEDLLTFAQAVLDLPCAFGRDGDPLAAQQRRAADLIDAYRGQ